MKAEAEKQQGKRLRPKGAFWEAFCIPGLRLQKAQITSSQLPSCLDIFAQAESSESSA